MGLGHAARSLELSRALERVGVAAVILAPDDDHLRRWIAASFGTTEIHSTSSPLVDAARRWSASLICVDSYKLSPADLAQIASACPVLCFDDGGRLEMPVDVLVNGAPGADEIAYKVPPNCDRLLGPAFQIVRREFEGAESRAYPEGVSRVLVTLGGGATDWLGPVLDTIEPVCSGKGIALDVAVGPFSSPESAARSRWSEFHVNSDRLPTLMRSADLAISAAGQTLFELARCGTPTIAIGTGEDQRRNLQVLAAAGAVHSAGTAGEGEWLRQLRTAFEDYLETPVRRQSLARTAAALIDGRGADRIADAVLRRITPD